MSRITTRIVTIGALAGLLVAGRASGADVTGIGLLHIVSSLDQSVAFYRSLLGVPGNGAAARPLVVDPELERLYSLPGGREGAGVVRIPGSPLSVELVEWRDVPRTPVRTRIQDPGTTVLVLTVRDLAQTTMQLEQLGALIVKPAGPAAPRAARVVFAQDPDGFLIKCVQAEPAVADSAPAGNVVGASFAVTVEDTARTAQFYRSVFGLAPTTAAAFVRDDTWTNAAGLSGAQVRVSIAPVPTTELTFLEFKNVDRMPRPSRLQDPGTSILRLLVRDLAPVVAALKTSGAAIMTEGGGSVLRHNAPITIARDPNNLYLEPMQPAPPQPR